VVNYFIQRAFCVKINIVFIGMMSYQIAELRYNSLLQFADDQVSPTIEALLQLQGRTTARSENEGHITTRLLVPSNQIGCLIGKAGSIISEMRKTSRADIRILSKETLPKCASQNDELVQVRWFFIPCFEISMCFCHFLNVYLEVNW
jgi:hypothetical protein